MKRNPNEDPNVYKFRNEPHYIIEVLNFIFSIDQKSYGLANDSEISFAMTMRPNGFALKKKKKKWKKACALTSIPMLIILFTIITVRIIFE